MRRKVALALLLSMASCMTEGKLLPEEKIESRCLKANRTIRIYLPPSYERERKLRYPVLYLHDGQRAYRSCAPSGGKAESQPFRGVCGVFDPGTQAEDRPRISHVEDGAQH